MIFHVEDVVCSDFKTHESNKTTFLTVASTYDT